MREVFFPCDVAEQLLQVHPSSDIDDVGLCDKLRSPSIDESLRFTHVASSCETMEGAARGWNWLECQRPAAGGKRSNYTVEMQPGEVSGIGGTDPHLSCSEG